MGGKRFPGKVLHKIGKQSMLGHCISRAKQIGHPVVVATGPFAENFPIYHEAEKYDIDCYWVEYYKNGVNLIPEDDVLLRFILVGIMEKADYILRICADQPFFSVEAAKELVKCIPHGPDYVAHYETQEHFPLRPTIYYLAWGYFNELVRLEALMKSYKYANDSEKTNVTEYIYRHPEHFVIEGIYLKELPENRVSINTEEDLRRVEEYYKKGVLK